MEAKGLPGLALQVFKNDQPPTLKAAAARFEEQQGSELSSFLAGLSKAVRII
jgi:hypothetical protein